MLLCIGSAAWGNDVRICTSLGIVEIELDSNRAPLHSRNFLNYVDNGFYNGTVLHRAVEGSLVQGGAYSTNFSRREPGPGVPNEAGNGLSNRRGTVAASRGEDPDSASSQFFFNLGDNLYLDAQPESAGYSVFGRVTAGMEVLDRIGALPTRSVGELVEVPQPAVELESVTRMQDRPVFGLSVAADPDQLRAELNRNISNGFPERVLAAATAMRQDCVPLNQNEKIAEAEALLATGRVQQARYALDNLVAASNSRDPSLPRIQALYNRLPDAAPANRLNELAAHCTRPVPPSIPENSNSRLTSLQLVEREVFSYTREGERYVSCMAALVNTGDLNEFERDEAIERHNDMVIELTATVTRFNQAVRRVSGSGTPATAPGELR